jgi:hypothetical protein
MIITGTRNGTRHIILDTPDEFSDARTIIWALSEGRCTEACVQPGTRPVRAAQTTTEAERAALLAIMPGLGAQ